MSHFIKIIIIFCAGGLQAWAPIISPPHNLMNTFYWSFLRPDPALSVHWILYWILAKTNLNNYCTKIILFSFFNLHNGNKKAKWTFSTQMWQMRAATMLIDIWHSSVNVVTLIFWPTWRYMFKESEIFDCVERLTYGGYILYIIKQTHFLPANNTSLAHVTKCQMWNSGVTLWVMVMVK